MKLNPTDGYVVNPWIIWGELDYSGHITLGIKPQVNFKGLSFLSNLQTPNQYIRSKNQDYLFVNFPLADFTPRPSMFNLTDKKIDECYFEALDNCQDEIQKTYFKIKDLSGHEITALQTNELAKVWQEHFNPLAVNARPYEFDIDNSILANCMPGYKVIDRSPGFELDGCLHHYIKVLSYDNLDQITDSLKENNFSISSYGNNSQILIHIYGADSSEIIKRSMATQEALNAVPDIAFYEASDLGSNIAFFEKSIPGWCHVSEGIT